MNANSKQVAGIHYGGTPVQHWDIVVMHQLNYFEGQITKYVMRARKKNGKQDLEKAAHFLEKYLEVYDELRPSTNPLSATDTEGGATPGYVHQGTRSYSMKGTP